MCVRALCLSTVHVSDQSSKLTKLQTNVSASASLQGNLNTGTAVREHAVRIALSTLTAAVSV